VSQGLLLIAPMRSEARLLRQSAPDGEVIVSGTGPRRARAAAGRAALLPAAGVAVAGFGGALVPELEPGDVVVASDVRRRDGTIVVECPVAGIIAGALERAGMRVHMGPVVSVRNPSLGAGRQALRQSSGAIVADMESAWLTRAPAGRPFAVVRVVLDGPAGLALRKPSRALKQVAAVLAEWAAAIAPRELMLAAPRASCAGVERAIDVVERALERFGPPVYMRKQIVHNRHVVSDLERRGAICVDELDEVPDGSTVVFSAHGVSPEVREQARRKHLNVIDGTCPLVSKVHAEARRFGARGYSIVLVGHEGHEEVEGTTGQAPGRISVIDGEDDVDGLEVADEERVAFLTQTTLAVDETEGVVSRLRERFPAIVGPRSDDICYATQNRQDAVKALAASCDLVLVVGSQNSSNSNRLVEVARRHGCEAKLIDDESQLELSWFAGVRRLGITAGASVPERIVQRVVRSLDALGPFELREQVVADETVRFALPREMR
jgi:4-hydroxy-3-methylbut-2-enyl diphosphate reductase